MFSEVDFRKSASSDQTDQTVVAKLSPHAIKHLCAATFLVSEGDSTYAIGCSWLIPRRLWAEASQVLPQVPRRFGCRRSHYRHYLVSYGPTRRRASCKMF